MGAISRFLSKLLGELSQSGKMLIGYILIANPWLTDYPMLNDALTKVLAEPTRENIINVIAQAVLALGAGHRIVKILRAVLRKM